MRIEHFTACSSRSAKRTKKDRQTGDFITDEKFGSFTLSGTMDPDVESPEEVGHGAFSITKKVVMEHVLGKRLSTADALSAWEHRMQIGAGEDTKTYIVQDEEAAKGK